MASQKEQVASSIEAWQKQPRPGVVVGFDGFIDEIISVVDQRQSLKEWRPVQDLASFGAIVQAAAGKSSLREIVVHRFDAGGCSVNLGDGLAALGMPVDCFATLGSPRHPAFDEFAGKCRKCVSWGKGYGRTLAFEFTDGKFMFSAVEQLQELGPDLVAAELAKGEYMASCRQAGAIALTNWTLYPCMTDCWKLLQKEAYAKLGSRPWIFIDLVDPTGRHDGEIRQMLDVVQGFEAGGNTVLGLNGNEGNALSRALGFPAADESPAAIVAQAKRLREKLGISQVVIHLVKRAACATAEGEWCEEGPYCPAPKKSTGAGDRFNAGYVMGLLAGLKGSDLLLAASATSGFFVRNARSGSCGEIAGFLRAWGKGLSA